MKILTQDEIEKLSLQIVRTFGNGVLEDGRYLFDQIQHLPDGYVDKGTDAHEAFARFDDLEVVVLLDPHPDNARFAAEVASSLGAGDSRGFLLPKHEAEEILNKFDYCDIYIISRDGDLLAVGTHEDKRREDGQRIVCVPIPNA
jgi:hypothetical protein